MLNHQSLLDDIYKQAKNNPRAVAIIHNRNVITYGDLIIHADKLADYLKNNQVREGSLIAILMRRSFEALAAILAIWKLKSAYLPLDPETPLERIKQILKEANPVCIVSEPALLTKVKDQNIPLLTLKDIDYCYQQKHTEDLSGSKTNLKKQLAYVIYTSGSTGTPKGVMVSQDNLKNHIAWLIECFQFSSKDVFSFNSPLAFDFSVPCMLAPLTIGARIIVTSESDMLMLEHYCQQLTQHCVTFVKWTPSYFKLLVEYVEKHRPDLSSFRYLMVAGEELLTEYVDRWFRVYPNHTVVNEYGPTETTVGATAQIITKDTLNRALITVPIGKAVNNTKLYVLDSQKQKVPIGEIGELFIGGASVACGYYNRIDLTHDRFIDNPFSKTKQKLYKTGDLVKQLTDGSYLYIGRIDHQVKVNGYRIELNEIEYRLLQYPSIKQAAVTVNKRDEKNIFLIAYLVLKINEQLDQTDIHHYLSGYLPHYMLPKSFHAVNHIPMNANGKRDFVKLQDQVLKTTPKDQTIIASDTLKSIIRILNKYVSIEKEDFKKSFFSLGITSLLSAQIIVDINQVLHTNLKINDLFLYSTPAALALFLEEQHNSNSHPQNFTTFHKRDSLIHEPIAIIAMECRYPGADNCDELWEICRDGKECITFFDLKEKNHSPSNDDRIYVGARGILNNIEYFDAAFFNYSPKEAHFSDPQHRLFLEAAWTALEKAGYAAGSEELGKVGVYASMNDSTYVVDHLLTQRGKNYFPDSFSLLRLMSSQFLATKIAYQLNCTGPALSIQTACSSSLVSVVLACQQLLAHQCDLALAGGVSITTPQDKPYLYQPGNIFSPDGHCRPFDENAKGTVFSNGLGVIVLKRLSDALHDQDTIVGVIKGASINNDGADKMSYAAPSIKAQTACIESAQMHAGIRADSIQYVEAHGTGTLIGDPIEIEALATAFHKTSRQQQFCALGSLKANMGHTHVAAGVGGLIKTVLALQNKKIPPTINFTQPNPNIDFQHSPFYINTRLQYWSCGEEARRAAVSAFGVGGTNAHVILEEAPELKNYSTHRQYHALLLSAKNQNALKEYQDNLIQYLAQFTSGQEEQNLLANVAYTLQVGRVVYPYRSSIVANSISDAISQLKKSREDIHTSSDIAERPSVVFLFPGQGTQYLNLSLDLYENEIIYKEHLDHCFEIASKYVNVELKKILFSDANNDSCLELKLHETEFAHPLLFSIEYALAQLLIFYGIKPDFMLGHSLGEYVVACLSGVFTLEDAIKIVCVRGNAIATCVKGEMLAIPLSQEEILPFCTEEMSIAAINAPQLCVVSGTSTAIQNFKTALAPILLEKSLSIHRLKSNYPFHSPLLRPAISSFRTVLESINRKEPNIPYLSNLTGSWITKEDVQRDEYWIEHMLKTVQFSACSQKLLENPNAIFLEMGPGNTLLSLLQRHSDCSLKTLRLLPSATSKDKEESVRQIAETLGKLWGYGCEINWRQYYRREKRKRIPLPTYPFQRERYWFDEMISTQNMESESYSISSNPDISFYAPTWIRDPEIMSLVPFYTLPNKKCCWIIFDNCSSLSQQTIHDLTSLNEDIITIKSGEKFENYSSDYFIINPTTEEHYFSLIEEITKKSIKENDYIILHFWSVDQDQSPTQENVLNNKILYQGFYSGIFIVKAFHRLDFQPNIFCMMVTTQVHSVLGTESINPLKSSVLGLCRVLPLEYPNFKMSHIDVDLVDISDNSPLYARNIMNRVLKNLLENEKEIPQTCAFRKHYQWALNYRSVDPVKNPFSSPIKIKPKSTYLITGGLGGMGLTLANWLSIKEPSTILLLVSRTPFPNQNEWDTFNKKENSEIQQKIKMLKQIIARGSQVIIKSSDVADYSSMKTIIANVEKLKGVFHLAGTPSKGLAVLKEVNQMHSVLSPKIEGTQVLFRLLSEKKLDFIVCASSLTAIVGGIGQVDYCAANLFLDSFMSSNKLKHCERHLTINWNAWSSVGMAANLTHSKMHSRLYEGNNISPEQATVILDNLLDSNYTQIVISRFSPEDETKRIMSAFEINKFEENKKRKDNSLNYLSKVGLYEGLSDCWKEILGVKTIDGNDNFYTLGGDSLLAIQLLMLLEKKLSIKISLQDLSHSTTLNKMLRLIESRPIQSGKVILPLSDKNSDQSEKTIYFIHPLGGTVLCYFPIIPFLNNTFSYYGIQDPELASGKLSFNSMHVMAEYYADQILEHQIIKKTEILLVGASFGGNMAIEISAHLKKKSMLVQKIIMIDSWANLNKTGDEHETLSQELESIQVIRENYGENSDSYRLIKTRLSWLRNYVPAKIDVPVFLLKAKEISPYYKEIDNETNGWDTYIKELLTVYEIMGNHDTMLKSQHLSDLGNTLAKLI